MATVVDEIPIAKDPHGVYRVGGTRVTLDLIVSAFIRGATPEEIVQRFPALELTDVYQVIGYYLRHRTVLSEYLKARACEEASRLEDHPEWSPAGLRERLMARRSR